MADQDRPWHNTIPIGLILVLLIVGYAVDYFFIHPGSRDRQAQIVSELKALPLPPSSTEQEFSSGFQPARGTASRQFISGQSERQVGAFYKELMNERGWQRTKELPHDLPLEFQKGNERLEVFVHQDRSGSHYVLRLSWVAPL